MTVKTGRNNDGEHKHPISADSGAGSGQQGVEIDASTYDGVTLESAVPLSGGRRCRHVCPYLRPAGVPLTLLLAVGLLVMLLPGAEEAQPRSLLDSCSISLAESIPIGLTFNSSIQHQSTYEAWKQLLQLAGSSVNIASYYWTLLGVDIQPDPSAAQGEDIFQRLMDTGLRSDITMKIARNVISYVDGPSNDTQELAAAGAAQVRYLDFDRLLGAGILHTKMWLVDDKHFFVGSANTDWRSLTQVKEMGALVTGCGTLAADMEKIFQVYWLVGAENATIPDVWPEEYHTDINKESPLPVQLADGPAHVYLSSSPPQLCPPGRTGDGDAIVHTIDSAVSFVYIAVMDYYPMLIYDQFTFWPVIDDALRHAAVDRSVTVRLLASVWNHTHSDMYPGLQSLHALNAVRPNVHIDVRLFEVPPLEPGPQIPFSRVNHNKYMVTDHVAYIGTSNWSGDYFVNTGGIGLVVKSSGAGTAGDSVRSQLEAVFLRDWESEHSRPLDAAPRRRRR